MNNLEFIESAQLKKKLPEFGPGDTVLVHYRIKEGEKTRIQVFEGTVINKTKRGNRATFQTSIRSR
jgi:large subunit ribosomal protein L19